MAVAGGFSEAREASAEEKAMFETPIVTAQLEEMLKATGTEIAIASLAVQRLATQVVAGCNYRVHAKINGDKDYVFRAFKPLPHTGMPMELRSIEAGSL